MVFSLLLCQVLCVELEFLKEFCFALKVDWSPDSINISGLGYDEMYEI